jgi:hypothetical protein
LRPLEGIGFGDETNFNNTSTNAEERIDFAKEEMILPKVRLFLDFIEPKGKFI